MPGEHLVKDDAQGVNVHGWANVPASAGLFGGHVLRRPHEDAGPTPVEPVDRVVDSTGAGDMYAAGFLYGLSHGRDLATCGRIASIAASEVIAHVGPRPAVTLADLIRNL